MELPVIDNSEIIAPFCPAQPDGDTFIYTELLDRSKRKGNNGFRMLKTFYHRSVDEFRDQFATIRQLCDLANVRACTRLAPRSFRKVGATFTKLVVEAALTDNFAGMKSLYNRACGITAPNERLWLFDVDEVDTRSRMFEKRLDELGVIVARVPSKRAHHVITRPFRPGAATDDDGFRFPDHGQFLPNVQLHKDNPTNLYIPDGAA